MKKRTRSGAIGIMTILATMILCCVFAKEMNPNFVSMLSGIISAMATIILGIIAMWQNKQYKEMSDKLDERQNAPEFVVWTPTAAFHSSNNNALKAYGTAKDGISTGINCANWFMSLDKPILHLRPISIEIGNQCDTLSVKGESEINAYTPYMQFGIEIKNIASSLKGNQVVVVTFEYENLYGLSYQKKFTFNVIIEGKYFRNRSWGKLSRAERTNKQ